MSNILFYIMSMFELPKGLLKNMEKNLEKDCCGRIVMIHINTI